MTTLDQLRAAMQSEAPIDRAEAVERLGRMGVDAAPAAIELIHATADPSETVRDWATNALENLGPPPAGLEPQLNELARNSLGDQAYWAVTLLGRLEMPGEATITTLAEVVVGARDAKVRQRAAWALGNLGPEAKPALPQLQAATQLTDSRLARLAGRAIQQIGS